ncbi:MAG: periplasmic heavy metal sensor [Deltaproteobacteria bacterium]|nr:periplasmic heavy metal sensor [Deltaproteobacteria bacterium]
MKVRAWIATLGAMGLLALPAAAQPGPEGAPGLRGPGKAMMKKVMREVGLSEQQIGKIQALQYEADRARIDIRHELQKARLELQRLMEQDKPNKKEIFTQIERIGAIELQLKKNRLGLMLDIRALVSPEQWDKLELLREERRVHRRERRTRRRFGAEPPAPPAPPAPPLD